MIFMQHVRGDAGDHATGYLPYQARHDGRHRFLVIDIYAASSSNGPTNQRVVISKSRDTPIHRS